MSNTMQKTSLMWTSVSKSIAEFLNRPVITDDILEAQLRNLREKVDSGLMRDHDFSDFIKPIADVLNSKSYYVNMYGSKSVGPEEIEVVRSLGVDIEKLYNIAVKEEKDRRVLLSNQDIEIEEETRLPNLDESEIKTKYQY